MEVRPVKVEAPVTLRVPSVWTFVLIVVAALTISEMSRTPNTTLRITETILVTLSLLIIFILKLLLIYPTNT